MQAALFAGFLSAFLIELLSRLEPDPLDTIQDVLIYQTQMMRNSSLGPYVQADFSPPEHIVVVNALFYASLGIMLLAAFIAMLIKTWVGEFNRGLQGMTIPEQRAKTREFRYLGMEHWKLHWMVALLPLLIQISLLLFAIGLVLFLFHINRPSFRVTAAIFGIGVIYYTITTTISVFVTSSPFHSPLSRIFGGLWRLVHAIICPTLDHFFLPNMDTTPATHLGRFGRWIRVSLQKVRPYSEKEFEKPITAATLDEFQLSTAASALQRIHDSVPNSPHSAKVHQSVWHVAGSSALRIQPLFKLPSCVLDRGNDKEYFSRLSPAGVVGLKSVFVRMRDERYKGRIVAVRHIDGNPSHSHEPMAQLVQAIFDLLPDNLFPDERYAHLHPDSRSNALRRDALLRNALPDVPILHTLRNTLLRNTLCNAPIRDSTLHDTLLPDAPRPDTTFFHSYIRFLIRMSRSMSDARLRRVPSPAHGRGHLVLNPAGHIPATLLRGLRRVRDAFHRVFHHVFPAAFFHPFHVLWSILPVTLDDPATVDSPVTVDDRHVGLIDCLIVGLVAISAIPLYGIVMALLLIILALELGLLVVPSVIITVARLPIVVLRGVLLCDDRFDDNGFRGDFDDAYHDAELYAPFFVTCPPYLFKALVLVYALFRNSLEDPSLHDALRDALFRKAPFRSSLRLFHLGNPRLDAMTTQGRIARAHLEPEEPKDLINILQENQLHDEEAIWLLNTLSGLHCDGLVLLQVSKMCLTILLHQAPKWNQKTPPNILLMEAVVTLTGISCSSNENHQKETLADSHRHPWLLVNLRNPEVVSEMITNINDSSRKELISLLFLVLYGLFLRGSKALAVQYLAIITAKCDFLSCASALTVIAPTLGDDAFYAIGGSLLAPQTQFLTLEVNGSMSDLLQIGISHHSLFDNYDLLLGASQFPDPKSLAILLLLSKKLDPRVEQQLQDTDLKLRNPWLQLIANVIARHDIPDEYGMEFELFHGHRAYNMIAALSLLRYSERKVIHSTARESLLLASFLPSREFVISSLALHHYLETVTSYSNPPPPSRYLSGAVYAIFSPILPDDYLPEGWKILHMFVDRFEKLSIEWRQTFAGAFFTMSCRPLQSKNRQNGAPVIGLNEILTWEYFCKEGQEPAFTDGMFSGLDWMAMAWSLHLSQQSGTMTTVLARRAAQPPDLREPPENEEFVLRVLCRLLDAAPYYSILPIVPKLREFVEWFDDAKLIDYWSMVSASIEGAKQKCERSDKFRKVNCMWYL